MPLQTIAVGLQAALDVVLLVCFLVALHRASKAESYASEVSLRFLHVDGREFASCSTCGTLGVKGRMKKVVIQGKHGTTNHFYCKGHAPEWDIENTEGVAPKHYKLTEVV
jgi:hypothetical protein